MSFWEMIVDEVSLEGLDGVTLSSLWIRLEQRLKFSVNLDCHTKNYVWKFIRQYKNFKFYILPVERPTVFKATSTIDYQDFYPVSIIKTENDKIDRVWGSCSDFFTRIDVSERIYGDPSHVSLEGVVEKYRETLVIVAADILRIKALIGSSLSVDEFLKNMTNNMHYAVLERIGRSRQFGECSLNRKPLFQAFGVRAKDIIYVFTILMRQNLINKSTLVITKDAGTSGVSGTVTTLTRFHQAPKKTNNQMILCDLLRFLWHQPEKTAFVPVAKEALGVPKFKRVVCYYNNVIDVVWREVESDKYNEMIARCQKKLQELKKFKQEVLASEDELSADEDDKITDVTQDSIDLEEHMTQFCLEERTDRPKRSKIIRRLAYKINDNVIYDEMKNDYTTLDEETEEKEDRHDIDYSKRNLFRGIAYQFSSYVQAGGEDGTTCRELVDCLGFSVKKSARVLDHLKMTKAVKSVVISDKRTRHQRFLWRTFEHNINDEYDIFEKQSGLNRMVLKQPNAFTTRISSNTLKRINFVLKILDDRKISHQSDLLCLVREYEKDSTTAMCCKTMALTLKVLADISAIRTFDVEIHAGEYGSKKIKLICHRLINSIDHPLLQLFIQTARKSYAKKRSSLGLFASITSKNEEERLESPLKQPKLEFVTRDDQTKSISARAQSTQKTKKRRLSTDEDHENIELALKKTKRDNEKKEKRKKTSEQIDESIERAMIAAGEQSSSFRRKQIKQENEKLIDEVNRIMVYRKHAANFYGLQGNAVRLAILHEFVCYWIFYYRGELVENSLVKPVDSDVQPPVHVDEIGWRRYVPPVPEAYGLPKGWFLFNSLVESIPLSLVVMTCAGPYLIKGLEEYLKDPIKKHYLLGQLPPVLAMALKRDRRISFSLNRLCESLCVMGLMSRGHVIKTSAVARLEDNLFYLHSCGSFLDTSPTPFCFMVAALPLTRYKEYVYEFEKDPEQTSIFWLHLRAACISSRFGHRLHKKPEDKPFLSSMRGRPDSAKFLLKRYKIEDVSTRGTPHEPRYGAGGFTPFLFLYRSVSWKINCGELAKWYLDDLQQKSVLYESIIVQGVHNLCAHWNAFSYTLVPKRMVQSIIAASKRHLPSCIAPRVMNSDATKTVKPPRLQSKQVKSQSDIKKAIRRLTFSPKEKRIVMLLRAAALVIMPNQKFWVPREVVNDAVHDTFPECRNKSAKHLVRLSVKETGYDAKLYNDLVQLSTQLRQRREIKTVIQSYPSLVYCTMDDKIEMFKQVFAKTVHVYLSGSVLLGEGANFETLMKDYELTNYRKEPKKDVSGVEDIKKSVIFNVYCGCLALSKKDGTLLGQTVEIYKHFPMKTLCNVVARMLSDFLVTENKYRFGKAGSKDVFLSNAYGLRRQLFFTNNYRHYFYHKFHTSLNDQACNFYNFVLSQGENFTNALSEIPGYIPVLVGLMGNEQLDISLKLPDSILTIGHEETNDIERKDSSSQKKKPNLLDRFRVEQLRIADKSIQHKQKNEKNRSDEEDEDDVNEANLVKTKMFKVNIRSNVVGMKPSQVSVRCPKASEILQRNKTSLQNSLRNADRKLLHQSTLEAMDFASYLSAEVDNQDRPIYEEIYQILDSVGQIGLTKDDLKERVAQNKILNEQAFEKTLKNLCNDQQIRKIGLMDYRYVTRHNSEDWFVKSYRLPKELRSCDKNDDSLESHRKPVCFQPRPWLKPDGAFNKPMFRWLCEGVFLRIFALPGVSLDTLFLQFDVVLQRTSILDIVEYLEDVGCLSRSFHTVTIRKPSLFGYSIETKRVQSLAVTIDALAKFSQIFAKTPMPDFVLNGGDGNFFSNR